MRRVELWKSGISFLVLFAAGLVACGETTSSPGNEGSGGGGASSSGGNTTVGSMVTDPVHLADYAAAISEVHCEWVTPCCAELGFPIAKTECSTVLEELNSDEYASEDPAYTYDPELAGACLAATREFYDRVGCEYAFAPAGIDTSAMDVCNTVFQGKLEPGAPCTVDVECAEPPGDDAYCTDVDFGEGTACIVEHRAAEGEPCSWTCTDEPDGNRACSEIGSAEASGYRGMCYTNDHLYCADGFCQQQQTLGALCTTDATCAEGYCSAAGECTDARNEGASCEADSHCGGGLYCESLVCTPKKANGDVCSDDGECQTGHCNDYVCAEEIGVALFCASVARRE